MNSNEGRWSIRLISIPSFRRSMCVPVGRPMSHESAGEREYFRRDSLNLLSGPQNRVSLPNKVLLRWPRDRMSYSPVCRGSLFRAILLWRALLVL